MNTENVSRKKQVRCSKSRIKQQRGSHGCVKQNCVEHCCTLDHSYDRDPNQAK